MRTQYNPIILLSTDLKTNTKEQNSRNYIQFLESLEKLNIPYQRCKGVYNGDTERSFLINYSAENLEIAKAVLTYYNQECILTMDNEGTAYLIGSSGDSTKLGTLKTSYDKPVGDYTKVLDTQQYITFK